VLIEHDVLPLGLPVTSRFHVRSGLWSEGCSEMEGDRMRGISNE
jgi:hypothetical protein